MIRKWIATIFIFTFLFSTASYAQQAGGYIDLIDQSKKTVVFLGTQTPNGIMLHATGVLVNIQNVFFLITAKHVVMNPYTNQMTDNGMIVFFNLKNGQIGTRSIYEIKKRFSVDWIFHKDKHVDIAMLPFGLNPQTDDVKTIPDDLFLTADKLYETYDVFFLSYQPGIEPEQKISPIIRKGAIALINDDKTFYIDGFAFPGNSGGPVFLKPSPIRYNETGITIGGDPLGGKFIGIIGEYITYEEIATSTQTGRPRISFEENTGLSKVWSVTFIKEIIESDAFKQQLNKFIKK